MAIIYFKVIRQQLPSQTEENYKNFLIIIIIIIIIFSRHRFSFFPGTSPLKPVVNPTTQASSLSL
jgi:hypothetical protein